MGAPSGYEGVRRSETPTTERPEAVRIWLLGGFRVSVGYRTIEQNQWRLKKAAALVKVLALAPGHHLHREQAMALLWPDLGKKAASNNLRGAIHAARRALNPERGSLYLASQGESLVLCPQGDFWVDVETFQEAAATARRSQDPAAYRATLELYAGDLLPEDRYEEWAEPQREELRRLHLALLVELAGLYEEHAQHGLAIEVLRKAVAEESTLEEAHAGVMRLYVLLGQEGDALAQYERLRDALRRGLGTEPRTAIRRLRDEIAAGSFSPTQHPSSPQQEPPGTGKHNLPAPRTNFVGREQEMVEVKRALAMTRLLTLSGAGGSGKTRLALEVARDLIGSYPDGVWLVELASLTEGDLVPQEVARALEVHERPEEPLADTLVDALRDKESLLVVDNCEHLVEAAARLVDTLLDPCPRLRVLSTSREPLGVEGEVLWQVPPLSVPARSGAEPDGGYTVEGLMRYEAVRLFVDRARLRLPDFGLTQENAGAVARVCRKLDGIPLAIELATARMGTLAVEQVAQRLDVSLDVLKSAGRSGAPTRQQTLRATLDWSHDLLSEVERTFFRRLSVFAGGWTLEAAEAVCSGGVIEQDEVLDLLGGLVDKSLVVAGASEGGAVRYRMLEPIRQYAREKLDDSGEADDTQGRHAEFFLTLAEDAEPRLWGPEEAEWLERLEAEHDNLRAALSWSLESGAVELSLRLAGALLWFWEAHGHYGEGRRWLEEALAKGERGSVAARAKALKGVAWLAYDVSDDIDRAMAACEEGLKLSKEAGLGADLVADFQTLLGRKARDQGDYERAKGLFEDSLALYREAGNRRGIAWSSRNIADSASDLGDHERAIELLEEHLILMRELGSTQLLAEALIDLGDELLLRGDNDRATALNEEATALLRKLGNKVALQIAVTNLGWAALLRGDLEQTKASCEESLLLSKEIGNKLVASESLEGLACLAGVKGEAERAARLLGAAQVLREAAGYHLAPAERALREPYLVATRSQLDEAMWEEEFKEGKAMGLEVAIRYALTQDEPAMPEQSPAGAQPPNLTRREREVASLVAHGLTNLQIAQELVVSKRTVETHVRNLLKKLGLKSREQVAVRMGEWPLYGP